MEVVYKTAEVTHVLFFFIQLINIKLLDWNTLKLYSFKVIFKNGIDLHIKKRKCGLAYTLSDYVYLINQLSIFCLKPHLDNRKIFDNSYQFLRVSKPVIISFKKKKFLIIIILNFFLIAVMWKEKLFIISMTTVKHGL